MRVQPGTTDQLVADWGATGATLGVRVLDNEGATTIARATGFVEYPAGSGVYYLDPFTFPDDEGSYTLLYDDDAGVAAIGHVATEELIVTSSAPEDIVIGNTYADVDELFRILKIRTPSAEQIAAGERVLFAAAGEINSEIDLDETTTLSGWQLALAAQVNLRRAAELWHEQEAPMGLVGLGSEFGATTLARDTWKKHSITLGPLKQQQGFA